MPLSTVPWVCVDAGIVVPLDTRGSGSPPCRLPTTRTIWRWPRAWAPSSTPPTVASTGPSARRCLGLCCSQAESAHRILAVYRGVPHLAARQSFW